MNKNPTLVFNITRAVAAVILLQTLFFKFSAASESVALFQQIGMEPWGRIGTGIIELIASILLFVPGATRVGAALGIAVMHGAVFFHLTVLGINSLFVMAIIVLVCCLYVLYHTRKTIKLPLRSCRNP